jgi:hypothetical protein
MRKSSQRKLIRMVMGYNNCGCPTKCMHAYIAEPVATILADFRSHTYFVSNNASGTRQRSVNSVRYGIRPTKYVEHKNEAPPKKQEAALRR